MLTKEAECVLEDLIDRNNLSSVIEALVAICEEKAIHVEANWQDQDLAKAWRRAAKAIDAASVKIEV